MSSPTLSPGSGETAPAFGPEPAWDLFHSNADVWNAAFELCEAARDHLTIEQYIFSPSGIGERLLGLLTEKCRQGVRVRLLADGFGSRQLPGSAAGEAFRRAGGELLLYNRIEDALRHPIRGAHRLHRKSILCDGTALMVGGTCFHDRMVDWRDTMIRLEGPVAAAASASFEEAWSHAEARCRVKRPAPLRPTAPAAAEWQYLVSQPVRPTRQDIYSELLRQVTGARRSVALTTPYFIPDRRFWRALRGVLSRGLRLRLLVPARSDHPVVDLASHHFGRLLAGRGAEVHAYRPSMMHAKIALVDEAWSMISSFNLDILSFGLNVENGVVSRSPRLAAALGEQFERDAALSDRL